MERAYLEDLASLRLGADPVEVIPGVWTAGEIAPRTEPEGRCRQRTARMGGGWASDPNRDDPSLVLDTGEGLVLLCGCCRAGLPDTLVTARVEFGREPVAVTGGIHLVHAGTPTLDHVVAKLQRDGPPRLCVGHCTGDRSFLGPKAGMGDQVSLCQAWTVLEF